MSLYFRIDNLKNDKFNVTTLVLIVGTRYVNMVLMTISNLSCQKYSSAKLLSITHWQ